MIKMGNWIFNLDFLAINYHLSMFDKVEAKEDRKATVFNNDEVDIDFKLIKKLNKKFNSA